MAGLLSEHGSGSKTEKEKNLNFSLHVPPQLAGAPFSDHLAQKARFLPKFLLPSSSTTGAALSQSQKNLGNSPPVWATSLTLLLAYLLLIIFQHPQAGAFSISFTVFHCNWRARL